MSLPPRRIATFVAIPILVLSLFLAWNSEALLKTLTWRFKCKPGPWGEVECVHIAVEMPEAFVSVQEIASVRAHWFFGRRNQREALQFLSKSGLNQQELKALLDRAKWEESHNGVWFSPPDAAVLKMNKTARQNIYSELAKFSENVAQHSPFAYRPDLLPEYLKRSHLRDETVSQFKSLLYPHGKLLLFSDSDLMVNQLRDEHEKIRFLKTISRASTLLVRLKVDSSSDIDSLVEYWGYGGRRKDVRALLESMAAVPGGAKIDVAHLLPAFLRQRIYSYPDPATVNTNQHCHWTSMNFLMDRPDDRFGDNTYVQQVVGSEFSPITDSPRLGDVVFLLDKSGDVIHSATFIADNIVFTKNGGAANRPWIYMELEDMIACYMKPDQPLQTVICRRKDI